MLLRYIFLVFVFESNVLQGVLGHGSEDESTKLTGKPLNFTFNKMSLESHTESFINTQEIIFYSEYKVKIQKDIIQGPYSILSYQIPHYSQCQMNKIECESKILTPTKQNEELNIGYIVAVMLVLREIVEVTSMFSKINRSLFTEKVKSGQKVLWIKPQNSRQVV